MDASDTLGGWTELETGVSPFTFVDEDRTNFPMRRFYRAVEVAPAGGMAMMISSGGEDSTDLPGESLFGWAHRPDKRVIHRQQSQRELPTWQKNPKELSSAEQHAALLNWAEILLRWMQDENQRPGTLEFYRILLDGLQGPVREAPAVQNPSE